MRRRTQCKAASGVTFSGGIKREGGEMMRRRLFQIMSWTAASFMLIAHIGIPEAHADGVWRFKKFDTVATFTGDGLRNSMQIRSVVVAGVPKIRVSGTSNTSIDVVPDTDPQILDLDPTTCKKIVVRGRGEKDVVNLAYISQQDLAISIQAGPGNDAVRLLNNGPADSEISMLIIHGGPGDTDVLMVENDAFKWNVLDASSIGSIERFQQ